MLGVSGLFNHNVFGWGDREDTILPPYFCNLSVWSCSSILIGFWNDSMSAMMKIGVINYKLHLGTLDPTRSGCVWVVSKTMLAFMNS